jgi:signal transduction histidine kinase
MILFLKKYWKMIFIITFSLIVSQSVIITKTIYDNAISSSNILSNHIEEFDEFDAEYLCKLSRCQEVGIKFLDNSSNDILMVYSPDSNSDSYEKMGARVPDINSIYSNEYLILSSSFKTYIYFDEDNIRYYFLVSYTSIHLLNILITLLVLLYLSVYLYRQFLTEQKDLALRTSGYEAIMANKTLLMVTDNINHEFNTPLDVIENKTDRLYKIFISRPIEESCVVCPEREICKGVAHCSYIRDYGYIKAALSQIYTILGRIGGLKNIRFSNGNKNIYNIVSESIELSKVVNGMFISNVSSELTLYRLPHDSLLKNADLLNIFINHIKNSLEAESNSIEFEAVVENDVMSVYIIDKGMGIPKDFINKVFDANISSKQIGDTGIRGNGMHINKEILLSTGGDVNIYKSDESGTTVEVKFKVELVSEGN